MELSSVTAVATVFAPTNAAFASLAQSLGVTTGQLLANTTLLAEVRGKAVSLLRRCQTKACGVAALVLSTYHGAASDQWHASIGAAAMAVAPPVTG